MSYVVNLIFYAFPYILGGLPVSFEKSPIEFVIQSFSSIPKLS